MEKDVRSEHVNILLCVEDPSSPHASPTHSPRENGIDKNRLLKKDASGSPASTASSGSSSSLKSKEVSLVGRSWSSPGRHCHLCGTWNPEVCKLVILLPKVEVLRRNLSFLVAVITCLLGHDDSGQLPAGPRREWLCRLLFVSFSSLDMFMTLLCET